MAASVYVSYLVGALVLLGLVYVVAFRKGPETEEGYIPRYYKNNEDVSETQNR